MCYCYSLKWRYEFNNTKSGVVTFGETKDHFPPGGIFLAERHFLLFKDQLAESGRQKAKENNILCGKFLLIEKGPKTIHYESMKKRECILGEDTVDELYEYKNLWVLKNCIASFSSNVDDNIEKTRNKAGMIFSSHLYHRKVNPHIYVKCLQSLFFGTDLFTFSPSFLKLERCQS